MMGILQVQPILLNFLAAIIVALIPNNVDMMSEQICVLACDINAMAIVIQADVGR